MEKKKINLTRQNKILIGVCAAIVLICILSATHVICGTHNWQPATCTEPSFCTKCGRKQGEPLGHTAVTDAAVPATCTEAGLTEGSHCSVCGEVLKAQETVPATGHKEAVEKGFAPTCTKTGLTDGTRCEYCGKVMTRREFIPATGHTVVEDKGFAPTCTRTGLTDGSHCSVCGEIFEKRTFIPATGHTVAEDKGFAPTCTETGLTDGSHCEVCGEILTAQEEIPATGHTVVTDPAVEPTYTKTGLTEGSHCSVCGEVFVAQEVVPVLESPSAEIDAILPGTWDLWSIYDPAESINLNGISDSGFKIIIKKGGTGAFIGTQFTYPATWTFDRIEDGIFIYSFIMDVDGSDSKSDLAYYDDTLFLALGTGILGFKKI